MTKQMQGRVGRRALVSAALSLAIFQALSAHAQGVDGGKAAAQQGDSSKTKPVTLNAVVVTGSKIKGVDLADAVPVTTITRQQIDKLGAATVTDVVNQLTVSAVGLDRMSGYTQEAYANLRGINRSYTLVLVNGHRWPGGASIDGNVDLNTIPLMAVDHIDVLLDGGPVLYGSDAMVGVINIILRDHYDGVEFNTTYGQYQKGGGRTTTTNVMAGHTGDRYSLLGGVSYSNSHDVPVSDYPFTATPLWGSGTALYTDTTPAGSFQVCNIPNHTGVCPAASRTQPDGSHGFFTYAPGQGGSNWTPYSRSADGYNNRYGYYLELPLKVKSVFGQFTYDVTDNIKFKLIGSWTKTSSSRVLNYNAMNLGAGGAAGTAGAITIPADSFYNPFGQQIAVAQRMVTEAGLQGSSYTDKTINLTPTLDGSFSLGGRDFDWEVGTVYGKTDALTTFFNQLSISRLGNALGPSFKDANGQVVCGTPGNVIAGCVPLNLLGQNTITPSMLDYIEYGRFAPSPTDGNVMHLHDTFAQISSANLLELPAGNLGFSLGFERNSQSGYTYGYGPFLTKDVLNNNRGIASGSYATNEEYLELNIPLLSNLPGVRQLDLDVAGRESKYDFGARAFNKQYTLKWKVTDDLALRAGYSTAFHYSLASSIAYPQVGYGVVSDASGVPLDPCSFTTNGSGTVISNRYGQLTPAQQQTCQAHGVPAGGYNTALAPQTTIVTGGNALLQPEQDKYLTWGVVYSPSYVPGLDITADWWSITFRKQITTFSTLQMMQNCLNNYGVNSSCPSSWFTRGAGGYLAYFQNSPINAINGNRDKGLDVTLSYRLQDTPWGSFRFKWTNAYLIDNSSPNTPIPNQNYAGTMAGSSGGGPYWRLRSNLQTDWELGSWGATWNIRYFSSLREQCTLVGTAIVSLCNDLGPAQNAAGTKFLPFMQGGSANRLGASTYHDLSVYWKTPWDARLTFGVNNVFNKRPPFSVTSGGASFNVNYGVPDRYFFVTYSQKFL